MSIHQTPEQYMELLEKSGEHNIDECKKAMQDIRQILKGMEKGLQMLQKMSRPPEKKVLDNQKKFKELEQRFEAIILKAGKG